MTRSLNFLVLSLQHEYRMANWVASGFYCSRQRFHGMLQDRVRRLSAKFGYHGVTEMVVDYREGRFGYIDVVWKNGNHNVVAIEIDSSFREKSINKLLAVDADIKVWIYYGRDEIPRWVSDEIIVLHYEGCCAAACSRACGREPKSAKFVRNAKPECPVSGSTGFCSWCIRAGWDLRELLCPWK